MSSAWALYFHFDLGPNTIGIRLGSRIVCRCWDMFQLWGSWEVTSVCGFVRGIVWGWSWGWGWRGGSLKNVWLNQLVPTDTYGTTPGSRGGLASHTFNKRRLCFFLPFIMSSFRICKWFWPKVWQNIFPGGVLLGSFCLISNFVLERMESKKYVIF